MNKQLMQRYQRVICPILGSALLFGCGSHPIVVSHIPGADASTNGTGMVYSLPKGHLQLSAMRKQVDDDDVAAAQKAAKESAAVLEADKEALSKAKAESKKANELLASASAKTDTPAVVRADLEKAAAVALAVVNYLTEKTAADTKVASAADDRATQAALNKGKWVETIELTQLATVPDASRRFIADLNHRQSRDDKMKITVANGLLSTGSVTTQDQTAAIVLNLVQAAAGFKSAGSGALLMKSMPLKAAPLADSCKPYTFSAVFDPTDTADSKRALEQFYQKSDAIVLSIDNMTCKADIDNRACGVPTAPGSKPMFTANPNGLVYRAPKAVRVLVAPRENFIPSAQTAPLCSAVSSQASSQVFVVPDSTQEFLMGSTAGAFTKNTFDFAFKDGMPTELSIDRPSELLSLSALPLDILKAIISVPASIIKLRVDYDSQATAQVEAQTAALNAEAARLAAQQALQDAQQKTN